MFIFVYQNDRGNLRLIADQRLAGDVVQLTDAFSIDNGHPEVGQIDDQALLDF